MEYTTATGKEILTLLQSAAGVMPVPLLQDAIGVAVKIVQACEVCCINFLEGCKTIDEKLLVRTHWLLNKSSKSCKRGSAIS